MPRDRGLGFGILSRRKDNEDLPNVPLQVETAVSNARERARALTSTLAYLEITIDDLREGRGSQADARLAKRQLRDARHRVDELRSLIRTAETLFPEVP